MRQEREDPKLGVTVHPGEPEPAWGRSRCPATPKHHKCGSQPEAVSQVDTASELVLYCPLPPWYLLHRDVGVTWGPWLQGKLKVCPSFLARRQAWVSGACRHGKDTEDTRVPARGDR